MAPPAVVQLSPDSLDALGGGGAPAPYPDLQIRQEGAQTTTKRKVFDPEHEEQIRQQEIEQQRAADARIAQRGTTLEKNTLTEQEAGQAATDAQSGLERTQNARAEQDRLVAAAEAESARRRAQMEKDAKITTYWEDKGKPAELFSIFMTGLSEMSNVKAGAKYGESPLAKQYADAIAKDQADKIRKFENSKYFVELAKQDVEAAKKAKTEKIAEIKDETLVAADVLTKRFKAYAAKVGTQEALAKADEADATIKETAAKSLAEQEKDKDAEVDNVGAKVTTTENVKDNTGKGQKTAGRSDVEARQKLLNNERFSSEAAKIATEDPDATEQFSKAQRWWALHGDKVDEIPAVGKAIRVAEGVFGMPVTKDELFKDAPPAARRLFELNEQAANQIAKEAGGPIANHDRAAAAMLLGLVGKTPAEMAKSARERATRSREERTSLEANVRFNDVPGSGTSTAATAEADFAHKGAALSHLIQVTQTPGVGEAVIQQMADRARAAGVPNELVDGLLKKGKKTFSGPAMEIGKKTFTGPAMNIGGGADEGTEQ